MKHTKHKLLSSIATLFVCLAMFIGSTYAWFTDSASTGVNKIQAGNLDIEVTHQTGSGNYSAVNLETHLFEDVDLWEPGVVAYENIKIENVGNLAAKVKLALRDVVKNAYNGHDLSEVIKVHVEDNGFSGGRDVAKTYTDYVPLSAFEKTFMLDANTGTPDSKTYGIVLYWEPSESDNLYNLKNGVAADDGKGYLDIQFGLEVVATQNTVENDSFNNQYDATATYPTLGAIVNTSETVRSFSGAIYSTTKNESGSLIGDQVITTDNTGELIKSIKTTDATSNSTTYDISYTYNVSGTSTPVVAFDEVQTNTIQLSSGLNNVNVTHSHGSTVTPMTPGSATSAEDGTYYYDETTGLLTIHSKIYSKFDVSYTSDYVAVVNNQGYTTIYAAINAAKDRDTIVLLDNTLMKFKEGTSCISIDNKNITIDGNGKAITLSADTAVAKYGIYITGDDISKTVTIKNTTINTTNLERAIRTEGSIGFKIENSTITTNGVGVHVKGSNKVDIINTQITVRVINNEVYTAHLRTAVMVGGVDADVTVNGSTINAINENKAENTNTWCKGLYVGNSAFDGNLTVNNTKVKADWSICIDGTQHVNKPSQMTINGGEYSGIIGSPSGYDYKSLIITGGTFTGNIVTNSFNGNGSKLVISGGTFNFNPISYVAEGYEAVPNTDSIWTVSPTTYAE